MYVDLTLPAREGMSLFPGLEGFKAIKSVADDTGAVTHTFQSSTHQATHIDAPAHYIPDGLTIDDLPDEHWFGSADVFDLTAHRGNPITESVLTEVAPDEVSDRVVLLTGDVDTRFGDDDFFETASVLTEDAAVWLLEQNVSLVANDFLTESLADPNRPVHKALLGNEVPIVEYLHNTEPLLEHETIEFICPPLKLQGLDGAPTRAYARI